MYHILKILCTNGNGNVARNLVYRRQWVPDTKLLFPHTATIHLLYVFIHIYIYHICTHHVFIDLSPLQGTNIYHHGKRKIIFKSFLGKGYVCFREGILMYFILICQYIIPSHDSSTSPSCNSPAMPSILLSRYWDVRVAIHVPPRAIAPSLVLFLALPW